LPPLEVKEIHKSLQDEGAHVPVTGLENYNPIGTLVKLASPLPSPLPKRALRGKDGDTPEREGKIDPKGVVLVEERKDSFVSTGKVGTKSRRWLRRRYRQLLAEVPSITLDTRKSKSVPRYKVDLASPEFAIAHDVPRQLRLATPEEMEWITKAERERWCQISQRVSVNCLTGTLCSSQSRRRQQRPSTQVEKEKQA
jgi:hypothetical protein